MKTSSLFALSVLALVGCSSDDPSGPSAPWIEQESSWVLEEDGEPVLYAYAVGDDMSVWERAGDCWNRAQYQLQSPRSGLYPAYSDNAYATIERIPSVVNLLIRAPHEELFIDWNGGGLVMVPGWPQQPGLPDCMP